MLAEDLEVGMQTTRRRDETSVRELAGQIIGLTGSQSRPMFRPSLQDDPLQRCPDVTLARSLLDWEPKVVLTEGLTRTIRYLERQSGTGGAVRLPGRLTAA